MHSNIMYLLSIFYMSIFSNIMPNIGLVILQLFIYINILLFLGETCTNSV